MNRLDQREGREAAEDVRMACKSLGIYHADEDSQRGINDHNKRAVLYSLWWNGYNVGRYWRHAIHVRSDAPTSDHLIRDLLTGRRGR